MIYYINQNGLILDNEKEAVIMEDNHPSYIKYVEYLTNDGSLEKIDYLTKSELEEIKKLFVPQEITRRQCKTALFVLHGIYPEAVDAFIETLPEPDRTLVKISWLDSNVFKRNNEMILAFAPLFGITTDDALDQLFIVGKTFD